MNEQHDRPADTRGCSAQSSLNLCALLIAGAVLAGCSTTGPEQAAAEDALPPFDAAHVAKLSHEAHQVSWDARFWARRDLRFAAFRPTMVDLEAIGYLDQLTHHVPWVARDIEKHPVTPRLSSKRSNDFVRYDAMMLKKRYQPTSFRSSTNVKIERLLHLVDEITANYGEAGKK